ncbi:unnamed protein product [Fraxinus pennsylvanica]|uniref:KOW domain-containing protein n=1 Tax=Fraxinus pennsylvanica TaxID=56036 RepID=A0AAD1YNY7_9LAMI|nr:unnamed protein product [Fraxinus pennsylvanica]
MSQYEKTVDGRKRQRSPAVDNEEDDDHEESSGCNRSDIQAEIPEEEDARIHYEDNEEGTNVEQQAPLPSVGDPKFWAVKSAIGHEREAMVHLMQKCIEKGHELQIRSVISLYHLKNYIYIKADKEVHVREEILAFSHRELSKYFEPGNHVKVVSGASEGATGVVVSVEGHVVRNVSDTTKDLLWVFSDNVVESSEVSSGITRIGDYELHDLVFMGDNSFGVIISVENEAFQVLKGMPERPDLELVMLREIKYKIDKKHSAKIGTTTYYQ